MVTHSNKLTTEITLSFNNFIPNNKTKQCTYYKIIGTFLNS